MLPDEVFSSHNTDRDGITKGVELNGTVVFQKLLPEVYVEL